jgi:DNA transformation protein
MSTSSETMDYLLDQLKGAGPVTARRMFGEYCLYFDGRPVGLVCDEQLYLKPTAAGRSLMRTVQEGAPFPGAKLHLLLTADDWEDRQLLASMVRGTYGSLPPPKLPAQTLTKVRKAAVAAKPAKKAARGMVELPNLGPKSSQMLAAAGIKTLAQLKKAGSVAAYARVKAVWPRASLNLLWALEGALCNQPWQDVARDHRTSLLLALEQVNADLVKE